ncbi:MAG: hypothetical protein HYX34_14275 [Actinobacteria bacterium]|nr:hypothetical protein [Actinomycetota bacterium]
MAGSDEGGAPVVRRHDGRLVPGPRLLVTALALALAALALSTAWAVGEDASGRYPGALTGLAGRGAAAALFPPTGSDVAAFADAGPPRPFGHSRRWRAAAGSWKAGGGLVRADPPERGAAVLLTRGPGPTGFVQVDVVRGAPGASLVFAWRGRADHWAVGLATDGPGWLVVRVARGRAEVVRRVAGPRDGVVVTVRLDGGGRAKVFLQGREVARLSGVGGAGGAVGVATSWQTARFARFAVRPG